MTEAWRGVHGKKVEVGAEVSDCMFPFEIGRSYLVFAHLDKRGRPWTSICTRTIQREKGDAIIQLLGSPPKNPS